jgi:hypothetical protein
MMADLPMATICQHKAQRQLVSIRFFEGPRDKIFHFRRTFLPFDTNCEATEVIVDCSWYERQSERRPGAEWGTWGHRVGIMTVGSVCQSGPKSMATKVGAELAMRCQDYANYFIG